MIENIHRVDKDGTWIDGLFHILAGDKTSICIRFQKKISLENASYRGQLVMLFDNGIE